MRGDVESGLPEGAAQIDYATHANTESQGPFGNGQTLSLMPALHVDMDSAPKLPVTFSAETDFSESKPSRQFSRSKSAAALLKNVSKEKQLAVRFANVNTWVPILFNAGGKSNKNGPKEKQVLYDVYGTVHPGEVLALMGPSGSGKSTLLSVIAARSPARTEGTIEIGSQPLTKLTKRKLGYVTQDDLLFAELTVWETLYYAAMLRLPKSVSKQDKIKRVELVIEALGLQKCQDTVIGGGFMRGVSGGERKRVSIGHELLINPSVIFLDEPTSGLDSTTALNLLHTLKTLALGGRTIITSIHQPASRLYMQMDKLLLLSEGSTMYYGHAQLAVDWFNHMGQTLPYGVNIADHILDLACGDIPHLEREESQQIRTKLVQAYQACKAGPDGVQPGNIIALAKGAVEGLGGPPRPSLEATGVPADAMSSRKHSLQMQNSTVPLIAPVYEDADQEGEDGKEGDGDSKWGAPYLQQVSILCIRSLKTRRFSSLSIQKFAQVLLVAVLAGLFWWQVGQQTMTTTALRDVGGLLFFMELFMSFAALFASLFTFPLEFQMLVKERQSGMYRLSAYYFARTLSDLPMDCFIPTLFVWILYWMCGLRINAGAFFAMWWSVLLILLVGQSVGLLIGATVMNPQNGQAIATILMLSLMLVGGYYVTDIPVWIAWVKYVSVIYWGWNLMLKVQFRNMPVPCTDLTLAEAAALNGQCDVADTGEFAVDVNANVYPEVLVLLGMLVALRIAVYVALRWKTSFKHG